MLDKNDQKWPKIYQLVIIPYIIEKFFYFLNIYVVGQDDQPNDKVGQDDQLCDLVGHENRYPPTARSSRQPCVTKIFCLPINLPRF